MSERAPDRSVALASPADHLASGGPTRLTRDDVVDAREVSELLHLPRSTVFEYARRGVLPAHKLGRRWIFIRDEVEAAVRAAPTRSPTLDIRRRQVVRPRSAADLQPPLPFDTAA